MPDVAKFNNTPVWYFVLFDFSTLGDSYSPAVSVDLSGAATNATQTGGTTSATSRASSVGSETASASTSTPSAAAINGLTTHSSGLSSGTITGIAVCASLGGLLVIGATVFMLWKRRRANDRAGGTNTTPSQLVVKELPGSLIHLGRAELHTQVKGSPMEKKSPELSGSEVPPVVVELDHGTPRARYESK